MMGSLQEPLLCLLINKMHWIIIEKYGVYYYYYSVLLLLLLLFY